MLQGVSPRAGTIASRSDGNLNLTAPLADKPPPPHSSTGTDPSLGEFELPQGLSVQATAPARAGDGDASWRPRAAGRARRSFSTVMGAWLRSVDWRAWLGSTLFHVTALVALSALILSPMSDTRKNRDEFGAAPLDSMELEMGAEDPIDMPADPGVPSLGPISAGNEISLPGERAGSVGNVRQGRVNSGAFIPSAGSEEVNPLAPVDEFGAGGYDSPLEALTNPLASRGGGLEGRRFENRYGLALAGGGSKESEAAVEAGLAWMAGHQLKDGSWNFDLEHKVPQCAGYCRNSGNYTSTTASTGMALLTFLGAGYTHKAGKYQEVVSQGLYYLQDHMIITSRGGDLRDLHAAPEAEAQLDLAGRLELLSPLRRDSMYSHGIATLAMTEAYAMTGDRALREPAEEAVKFIVNAQYDDGGWRYAPKWEYPGPGDVTVTGWQLMALNRRTVGRHRGAVRSVDQSRGVSR